MSEFKYLLDTKKTLSVNEQGLSVVQVYTDTEITNSQLFINVNDLVENSPLTRGEVNEHVADKPEEQVITDGGQTLIRVSSALKLNDPKLRDVDPNVCAQARQFEQDIDNINMMPKLNEERIIASETVKTKSTKAKQDYKKQRIKQGLGNICEKTNQPIPQGDKLHIHHDPREADFPELAAEQASLSANGSTVHNEGHKNDNEPFK
ncbi:hypothetical protein MD535_08405 [Vibrio sp. ZSDZ65]|uniref:Uncharacterized protein n=1 Tax=Vibrio qingdaonensis TaxID=2829491 RepID=A0A9X3HW96_9VIBR|nr:hypothetical protein [Vibrio qingdaonensis]MCW8346028.1 hypothetical protein [Vibrio qingdaonensis]